jgi:hypothetical protein
VVVLVGDQVLGGLGMGLQRIRGDHHPVKVESVQQWLEGGDLVGRAGDLTLGQHRAGGVVHRCQQVHRAAIGAGPTGAA